MRDLIHVPFPTQREINTLLLGIIHFSESMSIWIKEGIMDNFWHFSASFVWDEDGPSHAEDGNKLAGHESLQIKADNLLFPRRVSCIQDVAFLHASVWEQTTISLASYPAAMIYWDENTPTRQISPIFWLLLQC